MKAAAAREKNPQRLAWLKRDQVRREAQILQTIGALSHFVGDGAQPLHVTVHYNGWGEFPNPKGYTTARVHGPFESEFVFNNIKPAAVRAKMSPLKPTEGAIEKRTVEYLSSTATEVIPFYELEKAGGLTPGDARGVAFATQQLAIGASELRNMIVSAWRGSANATVGWPVVRVQDVLDGKDPYDNLYGKD